LLMAIELALGILSLVFNVSLCNNYLIAEDNLQSYIFHKVFSS
jgi:hypothetical protein